ncbi:SDR family oxidoreductase [Saccharopolyspora sp. ASAGF58]|uniref:SDR family oxidoreductase n=1 Tax=Saccharopolyspora sp. ASAGF58 TaxID=2719023 RepID=UPI0014400E7D|nr:SDR family oxidoreductase [Saccharopolyspora sp. ASAGF58]QIZ33466.1 SDR family oxidoreductase [Saccharopolyspora sp. ASAGF58]
MAAGASKLCLVTGATGYVGGRLVPRLLADGHRVRCLVRSPEKLRDVPWRDQVEVARGDLLDADAVRAACDGADVLFYLVHSLRQKGFNDLDRRSASIAAREAERAGISRIVYLGGVHPASGELSEHLRSRAEVGEILLGSGVPTAVLQAAVIIGSGSASFEMLRYLTERLPVMVTPRWVRNRVQPIAVRDVLHYLAAATDLPADVNRSFDIGGPDVLTYADMMNTYAEVAGLPRRRMLPVKVLSPELSSYWINIVTPVPRSIGAPLIQSLINEAVCSDHDVGDQLPPPEGGLTSFREAVAMALRKIQRGEVETRWADASPTGAPWEALPTDPPWSGGTVYRDVREGASKSSPEDVWRVVEGIGGRNGWYSFPLAWAVRGWIDRLAGGVGLRRGRRDPQRLRTGDALDWWRVEKMEEGRFLRLRAEMKVPGRAWLELSVEPAYGGARYRQCAVFIPRGLLGHVYWWCVAPFHGLVFGGMVRRILGAASRGEPDRRC